MGSDTGFEGQDYTDYCCRLRETDMFFLWVYLWLSFCSYYEGINVERCHRYRYWGCYGETMMN